MSPEFERGRQALEQRKYEDALKAFRQASDAAGQKCGECFYAMAKAYEGLGASKNVASSCDGAIELAGSDTTLAVLARQTKGVALQTLAETKDQNKLREAETEFRAALALDRDAAFLHFNLGVVLMQQLLGHLVSAVRPGGAVAARHPEKARRGSVRAHRGQLGQRRAARDFLSKNQMEWPEYWDRDRKFQQAWGVRGWPTYVVIDDEGIVRFRSAGNNPTERAKLEDAIKRQLKIAAGRQKSNR